MIHVDARVEDRDFHRSVVFVVLIVLAVDCLEPLECFPGRCLTTLREYPPSNQEETVISPLPRLVCCCRVKYADVVKKNTRRNALVWWSWFVARPEFPDRPKLIQPLHLDKQTM